MDASKCLNLCESVLVKYAYLDIQVNSCGPDTYWCPYCRQQKEDDGSHIDISTFPHEEDCPYVLASKIVKG